MEDCPICQASTPSILCKECCHQICTDCHGKIVRSRHIRSVCPFCRTPYEIAVEEDTFIQVVQNVYNIGAYFLLARIIFGS
jgi:hypothetical protein